MRPLIIMRGVFVQNCCHSNTHMWLTHVSRWGYSGYSTFHAFKSCWPVVTLVSLQITPSVFCFRNMTVCMPAARQSRGEVPTGAGSPVRWDGCSTLEVHLCSVQPRLCWGVQMSDVGGPISFWHFWRLLWIHILITPHPCLTNIYIHTRCMRKHISCYRLVHFQTVLSWFLCGSSLTFYVILEGLPISQRGELVRISM